MGGGGGIATDAVRGESAADRGSRWARLRLRFAARHAPRAGYDAFISYSHKADADLAPVLQRALHGFARPWYRLRALRVFRDISNLPAAGLQSTIERVLRQTRFLILLASPEAAASPWVGREVSFWCEEKSSASLLIAVSEGEVRWDDEAHDFDWEQTSALPPVLAGRLTEEPLIVDLRWTAGVEHLRARHPQLREATATIAATIHDRDRDELISEDHKRRRRAMQLAAAAGALIVAFAAIATWQAISARAQRDNAREQARQATSLALSAASSLQLANHPATALLLAFEAYRTRPRAEARSALVAALQVVERSGAGPILRGHGDIARAAAFSRDGRTLVTVGDDKLVRVWDVARRRQLAFSPLHGHSDLVMTVDVSRDGRIAASGSWDGTVRLWDVRHGTQIGDVLRHGDRVESVAFSPAGRLLAVASGPHVELWAYRARTRVAVVQADDDVDQVAFSPNGRFLAAAAGLSGDAFIWDLAARTGWRLRHGGTADSVAFSPDGRELAVGGEGNPELVRPGTVSLWNVRAHRAVFTARPTRTDLVRGLAFGADGRTLFVAGQDGELARFDTSRARAAGYLANVGTGAWGLAISRDRGTLAFPLSDGTVRLWRAGETEFGAPLRGSPGSVDDVAVSPDGRLLAATHSSGWLDVWDAPGRRLLARLRRDRNGLSAVAFSPSGDDLAFADRGRVHLWKGARGRVLTFHGSVPAIASIAFNHEGSMLATGEFDGRARLWSVADDRQIGPPIATPKTRPRWVTFVAFSSDGRSVAFAVGDFRHQTVRLVDVATRRIVAQMNGVWPLDSGVVAPDQTVRAASIKFPVITLVTINPSSRADMIVGSASAAAFSPDGTTLAVGRDSGIVSLWDVHARKPLGAGFAGDTIQAKKLGQTPSRVTAIGFSGDGETFAAGGEDGTVRVWPHFLWRDVDELERRVCLDAGSSVAPSDWASAAPGIPYRASCG